MKKEIIPVVTRAIGDEKTQTVDARLLHVNLGVQRDFSNWIKGRIDKYGFVQGVDFEVFVRSPKRASGNRGAGTDYILTLEIAKELAMVENNDKGREIRRYFIEVEKAARKAITEPRLPTYNELAGMFRDLEARGALQSDIMGKIMPLAGYGSIAPNGMPRTGIRRAAFVAATHRLHDAGKLMAEAAQLELRLLAEG